MTFSFPPEHALTTWLLVGCEGVRFGALHFIFDLTTFAMNEFFMIYRMVERRIDNLEWLGFRYDRPSNTFVRKKETLTPEFIRMASVSEWSEAMDRITSSSSRP